MATAWLVVGGCADNGEYRSTSPYYGQGGSLNQPVPEPYYPPTYPGDYVGNYEGGTGPYFRGDPLWYSEPVLLVPPGASAAERQRLEAEHRKLVAERARLREERKRLAEERARLEAEKRSQQSSPATPPPPWKPGKDLNVNPKAPAPASPLRTPEDVRRGPAGPSSRPGK
jgi:hypothetical protein